MRNWNLVFYCAVAVVVAVVAYAVLYSGMHSTYGLTLQMEHTPLGGLFPYNTSAFAIVLNNTGSADIRSMLVGFYVNGNAYKNYNVSIPMGQAATIIVNYTYTKGGGYSFEAVADPAHVMSFSQGSSTYANVSASVSNTLAPSPFSSIPNGNVTSSSAFEFYGAGIEAASILDGAYNLSFTRDIFSNTHGILNGISNNLYGTFAAAYGASASYSDGSSAQSVWMLGTSGPAYINQVIASYGDSGVYANGSTSFAIGGNASLCVRSDGGWTILTEYSGSNGSCAALSKSYNNSLSGTYSSEFQNGSAFMGYVGNFIYSNSTVLGTQFGLGGSGKYAVTWFVNRQTGYVFASRIGMSDTAGLNRTCYGLITNGSVCSTYVLPKVNSSETQKNALIESEERIGNYSFQVYASINVSDALNANYNAAKLIRSLGASGNAIQWENMFANTCGFNTTSFGCNVTAFNTSTDVASVTLRNSGNGTVTINTASCFMSKGLQLNQSVGLDVRSGNEASFNVTCRSLPLPLVGAQNSYYLYLNYTENGTARSVVGFLNITNTV